MPLPKWTVLFTLPEVSYDETEANLLPMCVDPSSSSLEAVQPYWEVPTQPEELTRWFEKATPRE